MKVSKCLADLGISDASIFDDCESLDEEVKVIKKIYFKLVRTAHPVRIYCERYNLFLTLILYYLVSLY